MPSEIRREKMSFEGKRSYGVLIDSVESVRGL